LILPDSEFPSFVATDVGRAGTTINVISAIFKVGHMMRSGLTTDRNRKSESERTRCVYHVTPGSSNNEEVLKISIGCSRKCDRSVPRNLIHYVLELAESFRQFVSVKRLSPYFQNGTTDVDEYHAYFHTPVAGSRQSGCLTASGR